MKNSMLTVHYLARAILLAGFAFFIVHLVRSDNLNLYIASRMQFIVKISALGLYAIAAQQLYQAIRIWPDKHNANTSSCQCQHEMPATWGKSILLYGWFALPLIIGFTVPDGMLGSTMAAAKGVQFAPQQQVVASPRPDAASTPAIPVAEDDTDVSVEIEENIEIAAQLDSDSLFPYDRFTENYAKFGQLLVQQELIEVTDKQFIETLTTLDLYRDAFMGKTVQLSGFVYRETGMGKQQFGISRFAISCCSADASPYGIMVQYARADTLATDEWLTVTGKLGTTTYNDIDIIELKVSKVVRITPPSDPYVSPDFDFGLD